jgi:hypothetical protein
MHLWGGPLMAADIRGQNIFLIRRASAFIRGKKLGSAKAV